MHCWNILCFCATFAIFQYVFIQPVEEMVNECTNGGLGASKRRQPNRAFKLNSYLYWINKVTVIHLFRRKFLYSCRFNLNCLQKSIFWKEFWWKRNASRKFNGSNSKTLSKYRQIGIVKTTLSERQAASVSVFDHQDGESAKLLNSHENSASQHLEDLTRQFFITAHPDCQGLPI